MLKILLLAVSPRIRFYTLRGDHEKIGHGYAYPLLSDIESLKPFLNQDFQGMQTIDCISRTPIWQQD